MRRESILGVALCTLCVLAGPGAFSQTKKPAEPTVNAADLKPISQSGKAVPGAVYADPSKGAAERTLDLVRRLTFAEKLALTGGYNRFMVTGIERLGIRPVSMADASQGVRLQTALVKDKSTSFPGMLPLASTWNPALARQMGERIGDECRALGVDILLGPGINMQRLSEGGRNFEYMGEDPLLTSRIATAYVLGVQDRGVITTPKHFICNDQDFCRHIATSEVSERALREIYLPPWESVIIEGGTGAMMTGNNLVNGVPACMQRDLIENILRREYGFTGIAMTDWQNTGYFPALQHLVPTSGETLMMPDNAALRKYIVKEAAVSPDRKAELEVMLEKMIFQTLYPIFAFGIYDRAFNDPSLFSRFGEHKQIAAQCGEESIVLLKNEKGILPVAKSKKILLTGGDEIHSGTGSGFVTGYDHVDYAAGLKAVYGDNLTCDPSPSDAAVRKADVVLFRFNKPGGEGRDIPFNGPDSELEALNRVMRLNPNVVVLVNACNVMPMEWIKGVKGILWCYFLGQERGTALAGIVSGAVSPSGKLPFTIERSFADSPDPDYNHLGGRSFWHGNNNYKKYWMGDTTATLEGFSPYVKPGEFVKIPYSEGIFIGYRWYDKKGIPVVYPFGYGLSYTKFDYESIRCEDRMKSEGAVYVTVRVKNSGKVAAKEVVQLYVSDPECSVERPAKELKAFDKVSLEPGQSKEVVLKLDRRAFSYWDEKTHGWKLEPGRFVLRAGGSGGDLPLSAEIGL